MATLFECLALQGDVAGSERVIRPAFLVISKCITCLWLLLCLLTVTQQPVEY